VACEAEAKKRMKSRFVNEKGWSGGENLMTGDWVAGGKDPKREWKEVGCGTTATAKATATGSLRRSANLNLEICNY